MPRTNAEPGLAVENLDPGPIQAPDAPPDDQPIRKSSPESNSGTHEASTKGNDQIVPISRVYSSTIDMLAIN